MKTKSRKARIFPALLLFCGFRACSHKRSMWIFEQVFGRIKSKIRRCTCVPQEFLAKKMAKNRQKDACKRLCEQALRGYAFCPMAMALRLKSSILAFLGGMHFWMALSRVSAVQKW